MAMMTPPPPDKAEDMGSDDDDALSLSPLPFAYNTRTWTDGNGNAPIR